MKVKPSLKLHLDTAILLLQGIKESLEVQEEHGQGVAGIPPEHSCTSIERRCVQARQEIRRVVQEIDPWWKGDE